MKLIRLLFAVAALSLIACVAQTASAAALTLSFEFDSIANGQGIPPSGPAPWMTTTFTSDTPQSVRLDISLSMLESEYVSMLGINHNDSFTGSDFSFTYLASGGVFVNPTLVFAPDSVRAGSGTIFDIGVYFRISNDASGTRQFNSHDSLSYLITYTGDQTFDPTVFDEYDESGQFKTIAHFQSISDKNTSAWVVPHTNIPEPETSALLGCFTLITLLRRRR